VNGDIRARGHSRKKVQEKVDLTSEKKKRDQNYRTGVDLSRAAHVLGTHGRERSTERGGIVFKRKGSVTVAENLLLEGLRTARIGDCWTRKGVVVSLKGDCCGHTVRVLSLKRKRAGTRGKGNPSGSRFKRGVHQPQGGGGYMEGTPQTTQKQAERLEPLIKGEKAGVMCTQCN